MTYFNGITDLEQAKELYRTLAKQLHPDKGGTANEFQNMQEEYNALILRLYHNRNTFTKPASASPESELLGEFKRISKVLLKNNSHRII